VEKLISRGKGRTLVNLQAVSMGSDLIICIYNKNAHIGAVAVGEYDSKNKRASVSVVTRLGHKDDAVAQKAAYKICSTTKKAVCVVAGIHLDRITQEEIDQLVTNADLLTDEFLNQINK
jgi:hypothetical protein